jgi:hypothetical protein
MAGCRSNQVHESLEKNMLEEAGLFNAGMTQLKEVKLIPEMMIDHFEEP